MRKIVLTLAFALVTLASHAQAKSMNTFINQLISKMTLDEKIGQLTLMPGGDITTGAVMNSPIAEMIGKGELGSVLNVKGIDKIRLLQETAVKKSRLGIPLLIGQDVIHGYETLMPIPLAQACSWDVEAVERGARVAAQESSAQGINWVYSPMVDVATDPRWGRVAEGYGEDPYLSGQMGVAAIKGYQYYLESNLKTQNSNLKPQSVLACLKHYALYGATEAGKDYCAVDMSRLRMFNQYFPPYKAAVEAGVGSVMSSFNIVDGIPATGNKWLMTDVLRQQWGFDGFTVTDYASINEMSVLGYGDQKTSAAQALRAGTDMDMCALAYSKTLKSSLAEEAVTMAEIDSAVRRVLEAKYKLGLFDDPYRYCNTKRAKTEMYTPENRRIARDIAAETFVLLKNEGDLLPLKKRGTIALIGPVADSRSNIEGCWAFGADASKYSTIRESMQHYLGNSAKVVYSQGCNIYADTMRQHADEFGKPLPIGDANELYNEAIKVTKDADVIVACLGEMAEMTGESSTRTDLTLPDVQMHLLEGLLATGKPVVLLNFSGRATVLTWESEHVPAIMNVWFGGSEMGDAICDVLFGDKSPSGKLVNTMPRSNGQLPIYYNHISSSRPIPDGEKYFHKYVSNYLDETNGPLYPFGYGLSYTTYSYSPVTLSSATLGATAKHHSADNQPAAVTASVTVTNTGNRDGDEIVQLYIHDKYSTIVRPVKELKGFKRIHLAKGESKTVSFDIDASTLEYLDAEGKPFLESGEFDIMIGPNSRDVNTAKLEVTASTAL